MLGQQTNSQTVGDVNEGSREKIACDTSVKSLWDIIGGVPHQHPLFKADELREISEKRWRYSYSSKAECGWPSLIVTLGAGGFAFSNI